MNHLFEKMMTPCHLMDKTTVTGPTGVETIWKEGAPIKAAIVKDKSMQARTAEKEGVTAVYTITAPPSVVFDFHDVIKRDSDGQTFRITTQSQDSKTPEVASFQFTQVNAERWDIPQK